MKTIRIGIVGTGGMAGAHATTFRQIPGVELTACLDVVPGRAESYAQRYGVQGVAKNLDQLLDQVDAVSVVTPDRFHAAPSLATLRAGKHLLCEKPLTLTFDEARAVAAAATKAERRGVSHMVNFSYRGSAAFQKAIALVAAGKLGEVRHVHSYYLQSWLSCEIWKSWTREALLWRLQTAAGSGGALGDLGCHILDMTTAVAGDARRVRCDLRTFPKIAPGGKRVIAWKGKPLDANDTAVIEIEFVHGGLGLVHITRWATGHANSLRLEVHGTEGGLMFDLDRDYTKLDLSLGRDRHKCKWKTLTLKPTPNNWQRFIRAIRTGRPDQPDVIRGAQVQAVLDACERSAKSGRWEDVRKIG
jgi:predicted dehydrogenase